MNRRVHYSAGIELAPDESPNAEAVKCAFQCATCEIVEPSETSASTAAEWTFQHRQENRGHTRYREILVQPYRLRLGGYR